MTETAPPKERFLPRIEPVFASLANYNFRLYWFGSLVSQTGSWMQMTALPWLVLLITHSPVALGTVTALQSLPILLLTLFAGVFVDRIPKQRMLFFTQSLALVQALLLGILTVTGLIQLWHIYLLALLQGAIMAFDNPTRQSFVVELVGRENVVNAVGLNSAQINGARLIGPSLAGLLIGLFGVATCFFLNAVSFVAVIFSLALMRRDQFHVAPARRKEGSRVLPELADGFRYVFSRPDMVVIVIVTAGIGCFGYNFATVVPLLATNALHVSAEKFGLLMASFGLGSLLMALFFAGTGRVSERRLLLGSGAFGLFFLAVGLAPWYALALLLLAILGGCGMTFATSANSSLQMKSTDAVRGRVMSLYTLLVVGSTPIGALFTGFLADSIGIRATVVIEAVICLLTVSLALAYRARHRELGSAVEALSPAA